MAADTVEESVKKTSPVADDVLMMLTTRRRTLAVPVLFAALSLGLLACGDGDVSSTASGDEVTTSDVSPDRESDQTPDGSIDRAAFDEAENLFASTVGEYYVMTFELTSSASAEAGPIRVVVANGRPSNVTYPDALTEQILPQIPLLTVTDFFNRARSVLADGGEVEVEFDEFSGHPLTMTLDPIPEAIDDEMSIVVQSIEPLEVSFEPEGY